MNVSIVLPSGEKQSMTVNFQRTIADVKKCICEKWGIPLEEQRLAYNGNEITDDNIKMTDLYDAINENQITMAMRLNYENDKYRKKKLLMFSDESIDELKETVSKECSDFDVLHIIFKNEELLQGRTLLKHISIIDQSIIYKLLRVVVRGLDQSITKTPVTLGTSVDEFTALVNPKRPQKCPIYHGNRMLESGKYLRDYNIYNKDTLHMKMTIYVIDEKTKDFGVLHVLPTDPLSSVKGLYNNSLARRKGIYLTLPSQSYLIYSGITLDVSETLDLSKTYESYNIPNGSTLVLWY
eukprot:GHVL01008218.1.p1 GENE.GHVL01008218.1~~GHVL01008218.1.p1  ORF type:complete len:295 (-),score=14.29 GHVL01008218.1:495-1379(-)